MVGTFNSQHECRLTNDIFEGAINFTCIIVVAQFFMWPLQIFMKKCCMRVNVIIIRTNNGQYKTKVTKKFQANEIRR